MNTTSQNRGASQNRPQSIPRGASPQDDAPSHSGDSRRGPVESFRIQNVSLSIFENEGGTGDAKNSWLRAKIDKRYRDPQSGEWKSSTSYSLDELLRLRFLIESAVQFMSTPRDS